MLADEGTTDFPNLQIILLSLVLFYVFFMK